jgi:hypothetical protein
LRWIGALLQTWWESPIKIEKNSIDIGGFLNRISIRRQKKMLVFAREAARGG